ncbi:MAG: DEAD/DEAH box helicase, partial [Gammaproteobacteria bacterium]
MRTLAEQPTDATRADLRPLSVDTFIAGLKRKYAGRITGERVIPAREGRYAEFPPELDLRLVTALHKRGVERLYRHQREAWDLVAGGRSTVVVTPTASGKTLCYNLPVLQA